MSGICRIKSERTVAPFTLSCAQDKIIIIIIIQLPSDRRSSDLARPAINPRDSVSSRPRCFGSECCARETAKVMKTLYENGECVSQ